MVSSRPPYLAEHRPPANPPRTLVLLSEQLRRAAPLDLEALGQWLETTVPNVVTRVAADLAPRFDELPAAVAVADAARLVLGLGSDADGRAALQAAVRRAGLDPLGVVVLPLGVHAAAADPPALATERCAVLLAAAVARARAFPGSRPEHLRLAASVAVSRRAFLMLALQEYHPAPAIRDAACAADRGCRRCVDQCPAGALWLRGQHVELERQRCVSCGLCASACPAGAVELPSLSAGELAAEIGALLDPRYGALWPRGLLFVCRQQAASLAAAVASGFTYPAGWLPVAVPCAGTLSPALLLACLGAGASAVGIVGCRAQCAHGQGDTVAQRLAFCQELLGRLGIEPERVRFCSVEERDRATWVLPAHPAAGTALPDRTPPMLGDLPAAAAAIVVLGSGNGRGLAHHVEHPQAPFGLVEIDEAGCTACGVCAATCPTGALARADGAHIAISFDAALCPGCGLCAPRCPEAAHGVLRVRRAVALSRLAAGRVILKRDAVSRCERCGAPVAPAAMLARLMSMLGEEYAAVAPLVTRRCVNCRGLDVPLSSPGPRA